MGYVEKVLKARAQVEAIAKINPRAAEETEKWYAEQLGLDNPEAGLPDLQALAALGLTHGCTEITSSERQPWGTLGKSDHGLAQRRTWGME